jgi:helicase
MNQQLPKLIQDMLDDKNITKLRPSQAKAIDAGLLEDKDLLVCTPTASGKTLVAEIGIVKAVTEDKSAIGVYVVPLRALASEKYKEFSKKYPSLKVTLTSGDMDSDDKYLGEYDIIITTSEKLDSLIRHHAPWIGKIRCLVIDEIHLLNDPHRGPTLEVLITLIKRQISTLQLIGLSATIGNAGELAEWLQAELVEDLWRPVKLEKAVALGNKIYFPEEDE